jgi:squalene-hopene/tetraprenyl-beta-curcumene cyclase
VNYIYGTWSALCAFNAAGLPPEDPAVAKAAGMAQVDPEPGWRLGRGLQQLRAGPQGPHPRTLDRIADRVGAARPDGGG